MKIVKVLSIRDTRQYEECGDKWVPIPGSGSQNECARCGRLHEVHAEVELEDKSVIVVGTGCAAKEDSEAAKRFLSLDRAAKRLAQLKAESAAYEAKRAEFAKDWEQVLALEVPALVEGTDTFKVGRDAGQPFGTLSCGDATVRCWANGRTPEREQCAVTSWRTNRMAERGWQYGMGPRPGTDYAREIRKTEARIKAMSV